MTAYVISDVVGRDRELVAPSMARAREWYRSPEYAAALDIRQDALSRSLIFVAGADEA